MKESAETARTWLRCNGEAHGLRPKVFEEDDLHIHVPAGARPKEGPSAGVTMAVALASLFTRRRLRAATALTGELTLAGRVLPVGGVREKLLAAQRAGIKAVILPKGNEPDCDDIPDEVRRDVKLLFCATMADVLEEALEPSAESTAPSGGHEEARTSSMP